MAEAIVMTALSPTMDTGTIVSWVKKEGDQVSSGDVICEVETDKATMDYESLQEGTLLKVLAEEGASVRVGDPIAVLGEPGEDISVFLQSRGAPVHKPVAKEKAETSSAQPPENEEKKPAASSPPPADRATDRVKASPLARKLAEELGIDLHHLRGSGPGGRIIKRDLEESPKPKTAPAAQAPLSDDGVEKRETASGKRKVIAQRLSESMRQAPHYYEKVHAVMDGLLSTRERLNRPRERKLSLNSFLIKFAAETLKNHPALRSSWQEGEIVTYGRIDIGLAVALEDGLITPVIRDCTSKSIVDIDAELAVLVEKAKAGRLQPEEYTGAIFTISNLGAWGIEEFTAVINPPGSSILAVGAARRTPVAEEDGSMGVRTLAALTLSADHRVIDGAKAAAFLVALKNTIEYPLDIML